MTTNEKDHKQSALTSPFGHYRRTRFTPRDFQDFSFIEIDGVKVLDQPSNSTVTSILNHGPSLESELMQAMTYAQRSYKRLGHALPVPIVRQKFPTIDKFCDDDQILEICCSDPSRVRVHQYAVNILSERTQISPTTIDRYFRNPTKKAKPRGTKRRKRRES